MSVSSLIQALTLNKKTKIAGKKETRKSLAQCTAYGLDPMYLTYAWMSKSDKCQRRLIICIFSKAFPFVVSVYLC